MPVFSRALVVLNVTVLLSLLMLLLLQPIAINSMHFDDTILLGQLGWRGMNGLTPVIDYPHFYGGLLSDVLTMAFELFGPAFKSINYAFAMIFAATTASMLILGWQRLSFVGLSVMASLAAALILSLAPIETGPIISPRAAHSFVYNHAGIVLMMGLVLFAIKTVTSTRMEQFASFNAGISIYVLILLKATFAILAPFILLAILIQRRWQSAGLIVFGAIVGMLLFDPWMVRVFGSLEVLLATAAAETVTGPGDIVSIIVHIVASQFLTIFLVLGLLTIAYLRIGRSAVLLGACAALCTAGFIGTLGSMGGAPYYKLLPVMVVIALVLAEKIVSSDHESTIYKQNEADFNIYMKYCTSNALVAAIPLMIAYSIILPSLSSAALTYINTIKFQYSSLIPAGPGKNLVVKGAGVYAHPRYQDSLEYTINQLKRSMQDNNIHIGDSVEYIMLSDGYHLLSEIENIRSYGIVSNGRMFDFTFLLMSEPVTSFPIWPTDNLSYFNNDEPLENDIDIVMISLNIPNRGLLGDALMKKMSNDFVVCRESVIWTLYVRKTENSILCERN